MDLYEYLCFILLTTVCYIDAAFILTEKEYTWSEATQVCTLATPHLNFTANGITPYLVDQSSADSWLGYVEKKTSFEYFGCAKKDDLGLTTANFTTEGDPGICWSACYNVAAVAVYKNECFCLQSVTTNKLVNDSCKNLCPSQQSFVCGGKLGNEQYVSLYKVVALEDDQVQSANGACLLYDIYPPLFEWGRCSDSHRVICYNDTQVLVHPDEDFKNWSSSTVKCFEVDGIPSNFININNFNTSIPTQMWTGIIRNGVIYSILDGPNVTAAKHGYISSTGNLLFIKSNTVTKRALCVKESSDVGAIVGATVAIIIVISVVIVLVVLWKRGMKFPFKKARELERKKTQATNMTYNFARPNRLLTTMQK